jgi:hypothetical protein
LKIGRWIEETISGAKPPEKRLLGDLMNIVKRDDLCLFGNFAAWQEPFYGDVHSQLPYE